MNFQEMIKMMAGRMAIHTLLEMYKVDEVGYKLFDSLLDNGCPPEVIIKTFKQIIESEDKE